MGLLFFNKQPVSNFLEKQRKTRLASRPDALRLTFYWQFYFFLLRYRKSTHMSNAIHTP